MLEPDAADLPARYEIEASLYKFDVLDTASFDDFVGSRPALPDVVISIIGLLGVQPSAESDLAHATTIMRSNYEGPSLILGLRLSSAMRSSQRSRRRPTSSMSAANGAS